MNKTVPVIFIVDDDADVRRAIARMLAAVHYETRTFGSGRDFLARHDPHLEGCVILDLVMPDISGLQVQQSLLGSGCQRPIVFLSAHGSIETSVHAMRAGAVTFLTKPVAQRALLAAIDEALLIDAERRRVSCMRQCVQERLATLTPRELQVFAHVIAGRMNKQIAGDLGTVVKTIKVHRARVMHKMGARSLAHLVRLATTAGIVPEVAAREPKHDAAMPREPVDRLAVETFSREIMRLRP
jgi:FixJ family two-component response regulator